MDLSEVFNTTNHYSIIEKLNGKNISLIDRSYSELSITQYPRGIENCWKTEIFKTIVRSFWTTFLWQTSSYSALKDDRDIELVKKGKMKAKNEVVTKRHVL